MKALLKFRRRIEGQWAEQIQTLRQIRVRITVTAERALQSMLTDDCSLIPVPVRAVANRRRFDRSRSRD